MIVNLEYARSFERGPDRITGIEPLHSDSPDDVIFCIKLSERADFEDVEDEFEEKYGTEVATVLIANKFMDSVGSKLNLSTSAYTVGQEGDWKIILTYQKSYEKPEVITGIVCSENSNASEVTFEISLTKGADFAKIKEELERKYALFVAQKLAECGMTNSTGPDDEIDDLDIKSSLVERDGELKLILTYIKKD
jgi:hypothetical protein